MTASEIIAVLAQDIKKHGDRDVYIKTTDHVSEDVHYAVTIRKARQYFNPCKAVFWMEFI